MNMIHMATVTHNALQASVYQLKSGGYAVRYYILTDVGEREIPCSLRRFHSAEQATASAKKYTTCGSTR